MATVLFVDDEQDILRSIRRQLRKEDYEIVTANSGAEAVEVLEKQEIHVIVSDMRMPGMTGNQVLAKAAELQPDAVRLVLSGYADVELILDSINQGKTFQYITKPWNNESLIITIRQALEHYQLITERKVMLEQLQRLNESLEEKVQARTRELEGRNSLLEYLLEVHDEEELLNHFLNTIEATFTPPRVLFYKADLEGETLTLSGSRGTNIETDERPLKGKASLLREVYLSGKPLLVPKAASHEKADPDRLERFGIVADLLAPVARGGKRMGVLEVFSVAEDPPLEDYSAESFMGLANLLAIGLADSNVNRDVASYNTDVSNLLSDLSG